MAEVWTFKNEPYSGLYTKASMTHQITRRYVITGLVSWAPVGEVLRTTPGAGTYPPWIAYSQQTYYMMDNSNAGLRTVYLYPRALRVVNMPSAHCLEVDVEYAGRVLGTHGLMSRTQMSSQIRYESLEPEVDGTYKGLGVEFEGVPTDVPMVIHTAIQVLGAPELVTMAAIEDLLAGSVNEDDWISPWGEGYGVGQVIYLGPQQAVLDRDTETVTVQQVFARMQNRKHQHIFRWREYEQSLSDTGQKVRKYKAGAYEEGKILKIAGFDHWWDEDTEQPPRTTGTPIPEFAALGLTPPIL